MSLYLNMSGVIVFEHVWYHCILTCFLVFDMSGVIVFGHV